MRPREFCLRGNAGFQSKMSESALPKRHWNIPTVQHRNARLNKSVYLIQKISHNYHRKPLETYRQKNLLKLTGRNR